MGTTTFTGPVKAGNVLQSDGTGNLAAVGGSSGTANVGFTLMAQSEVVTQAGQNNNGIYVTSIVIPAQSQVFQIQLNVTTVWDGVAATMTLGTTVDSSYFSDSETGGFLGQVLVGPNDGPSSTTPYFWANVGDTDVQVQIFSTNTGAGVGTLTVLYVQAVNLLLP